MDEDIIYFTDDYHHQIIMYVSGYLQILLILLVLRNGMCVSDYLRKYLYKTWYKVILGVVISEVFKITCNSKLKPLFMLFLCICIFACASCVNAEDVGDAVSDSQMDFVGMDISESAVSDENLDAANDVLDYIVINHHSHSSNKTHFSHKDKKFRNDSDANHHGHSIHKNGTGGVKHHHKGSHHSDRPMSHHRTERHTDYGDVQNEKSIRTDISAHIFNNATKSIITGSHDSKFTGQSEFSCCRHGCSGHSFEVDNRNAVISRNIEDGSAYSRGDYYVQFNTAVLADGSPNSKNRSFRNLNEWYVLNITSDVDWDGELRASTEDTFYGSPAGEVHGGLNIDSLYSELNVNDYNMEYYIFTNPDIIVKAQATENFAGLAQTNILNHRLNFDAKTTYFYDSFSWDCIIEDNYALFNTTFSKKANFMLMEVNTLISSVQSPVILSDESANAFLLIFGGIK